MKIAVLADIHANLEALREVLDDIDAQCVADVVSLGDSIGYGPNPEEVLRLLRARNIDQVAGNHESALIWPEDRVWFNPTARTALSKTESLLSASSLDYVKTLPKAFSRHGCLFVHGCPPDSARQYIYELKDDALRQRFDTFPQQLCFVGHTHALELMSLAAGNIQRLALSKGIWDLAADKRYIINAGSVGQPRDGDPRAKYLLWEPEAQLLYVRYVPYDVATTAAKILARGMPEQYARRLWGNSPPE